MNLTEKNRKIVIESMNEYIQWLEKSDDKEKTCKDCTHYGPPLNINPMHTGDSAMYCSNHDLNYDDIQCQGCSGFTEEKPEPVKEIKEPIRWRAKQGGLFWFISAGGQVYEDKDRFDDSDNWRYLTHNYYETEKQCRDYKEAVRIQSCVDSMADYIKPWPLDGTKIFYYIGWSFSQDKFEVMSTRGGEPAFYAFDTEVLAQNAIEINEQSRLKFMMGQGVVI